MHRSVLSIQLRDALELVQLGGALLTGCEVLRRKGLLVCRDRAVEELGEHGVEIVT